MSQIDGSVGRDGKNAPADVTTIQQLLNAIPPDGGGPDTPLAVDGKVGPKTIRAIETFQRVGAGFQWPDGRIDPGGRTWQALVAATASGAVPTADTVASGGTETSTVGDAAAGSSYGFGGAYSSDVREDQLRSFIDVEAEGDFRGSIFFPSAKAELDAGDIHELERFSVYGPVWKQMDEDALFGQFRFRYLGFADPRRIKPRPGVPKSNIELTDKRAQAVKQKLEQVLTDSYATPYGKNLETRYEGGATACGVDPQSVEMPKKSYALFRRVDVFGPPVHQQIPSPRQESRPTPPCVSKHWRARMMPRSGIPVSAPRPVPGPSPELFAVQIEDRDGACGSQYFLYVAGGVGIGLTVNGTSDWADFDTKKAVGIADFKDQATHAAVAMTVAGPFGSAAYDVMQFFGPFFKVGTDPVTVTWPSVSWYGSPGGEITITTGALIH